MDTSKMQKSVSGITMIFLLYHLGLLKIPGHSKYNNFIIQAAIALIIAFSKCCKK